LFKAGAAAASSSMFSRFALLLIVSSLFSSFLFDSPPCSMSLLSKIGSGSVSGNDTTADIIFVWF